MADESIVRKSFEYDLDLPQADLGEVLEVRRELPSMIQEIAREKGDAKTLNESNFRVTVGEPFTGVEIIIGFGIYMAVKVGDKLAERAAEELIDKVEEIWKNKILPELRRRLQERFGRDVVVEKDNNP